MRESRKKGSRRDGALRTDTRSVRSAFVVNMFREFPDRVFSLKQLSSASGGNTRDGRYIVRDIVEALVAEGVVDCHGRDKYQLSMAQLPRYEGVGDMIGSGAAYVKVEELETDIYINQRNMNFALDGDKVEVVLQRQAHREGDHPEGVVASILERSKRQYVGVAEVSRAAIFVRSDSRKLPFDIFFPRKEYPKVNDGDKVVFHITDWRPGDKSPRGVIVDVLGRAGDNATEMHAIMAEFDLPYKFEQEILDAASTIDGTITLQD